MTDALPADRALNRDELDALACEWSDHAKDYGAQNRDRAPFAAGWTARHLHGYTPDPQVRMAQNEAADAFSDARAAAVARATTTVSPSWTAHDMRKLAGYAYDLGFAQAHGGEPEPPESDEPEAEDDGRIEYGPAPAKRTLSEALEAIDRLVDEFASAIHVASLDVEDREDGAGEAIRDALGREALHDERATRGSHVVYPITRIFARAVIERLLIDTPVVLDIRPEVA